MNYVGGGIKLKAFCNFIPANLANAILVTRAVCWGEFG